MTDKAVHSHHVQIFSSTLLTSNIGIRGAQLRSASDVYNSHLVTLLDSKIINLPFQSSSLAATREHVAATATASQTTKF